MCAALSAAASPSSARQKTYDYLLKFLLVGDSDVGKEEILSGLEDGASESPYGGHSGKSVYEVTCVNHNWVLYQLGDLISAVNIQPLVHLQT